MRFCIYRIRLHCNTLSMWKASTSLMLSWSSMWTESLCISFKKINENLMTKTNMSEHNKFLKTMRFSILVNVTKYLVHKIAIHIAVMTSMDKHVIVLQNLHVFELIQHSSNCVESKYKLKYACMFWLTNLIFNNTWCNGGNVYPIYMKSVKIQHWTLKTSHALEHFYKL